jgi:hypothetical protein
LGLLTLKAVQTRSADRLAHLVLGRKQMLGGREEPAYVARVSALADQGLPPIRKRKMLKT